MKAELLKSSGWDLALYAARKTQNPDAKFTGKMPSADFKRRLALSCHSPARLVQYMFELELPNKTAIQLCRHGSKNGLAEWFVSTLRSDLTTSNDIDVTRLTERKLCVVISLPRLVEIGKARICKKAEQEAQDMLELMIDAVIQHEMEGSGEYVFGRKLFMPDCLNCREVFINCRGVRMQDSDCQILAGCYNLNQTKKIL
jgi:hypothetical protein